MLIATLLQRKGDFVATIPPDATVADLLRALAEENVGALVVSRDGHHVDGVASERDVARHLARHGAATLDRPVSAIMTADVRTCSPDDGVETLMETMTRAHIRHVPVLHDGVLAGIVSIGDIVKTRVDELQGERDDLINYITH
jgi:CBS domain-containing protein